MSVYAGIWPYIRSGLRSGLNPLRGHPATAAQIAQALGYGTWTNGAGWLMQEASGNLAAAFGAPTLTATSLTYQNAGTTSGDYAIGFDAGTDRADGGNILDVTETDDLLFAWIGFFSAAPSAVSAKTLFSKYNGAAGGWQINFDNVSGRLYFQGFSGAGATLFTVLGADLHIGSWHAGIASVGRASGKAGLVTRSFAGSLSAPAEVAVAATSMSNANALRFGDRADNGGNAATTFLLSAAYGVSGPSVATGLSTNLSVAAQNLVSAVAP